MKVLFVARTYPPIVGGMQKFASDFYNSYRKMGSIDLLANTGGNRQMVLFFIKTFFYLMVNARKYQVVHFSDAILFPLLPVIRLFSNARVTCTVHGLDVVYSKFGYQSFVLPFLRRADKVFSVSEFTREQCVARGVLSEKIRVVPNCINSDEYKRLDEPVTPPAVFKNIPAGKSVLLTVGRLIKRKGHAWFISNVLKQLPDDYVYVIAGSGPEQAAIEKAAADVSDRVYMLGEVSEEEKRYLYKASYKFVMPNIRVEGDQEGFGIVLLEAGLHGLPVVAAGLEGIRNAVIDGKTGYLVGENDAQGFVDAILDKDEYDPVKISEIVVSSFDCLNIIKNYYVEFGNLCAT